MDAVLARIVKLGNNAAKGARALRIPNGHTFFTVPKGDKIVYTRLHRLAQHTVCGARHTDIGDISGAMGQNTFISGGNVGMCAKHQRNTTVQKVTHRLFFRGSLGVKIHRHDITRCHNFF